MWSKQTKTPSKILAYVLKKKKHIKFNNGVTIPVVGYKNKVLRLQ